MTGIGQPDRSGLVAAANLKQFPNVTHYRDRHKKLRWRWRKDGTTVQLGTNYGSAEFISRYAVATNSEPVQPGTFAACAPSRFQNGTLSWVIDRWYSSAQFEALSKGTQKGYRSQAEKLRYGYGDYMVSTIRRRHINEIMAAKAQMPSAANHALRILRFLLDEAIEMGLIQHNVARDVKKFQVPTEGFHTGLRTRSRRSTPFTLWGQFHIYV